MRKKRKERKEHHSANAYSQDNDIDQITSHCIKVEIKCTIEWFTNDFQQALCEAAASGDLATVEELLSRDLGLNDIYVHAALHAAAQYEHLRIVKKLLNSEADSENIQSFD